MRYTVVSLMAFSALFALAPCANANVNFNQRTSTYHASFTDTSAFSDASTAYDVIQTTTADNPGDTLSNFFNLKSGFLNYSHTSTGDLIINNETFDNTVPRYNFTLAAPSAFANSGKGSETFHYDTHVASDFGSSWLVNDVTGGYNTLEFSGGGNAINTAYPIFNLDVFLPGNWSHMGTTTGSVQFLAIDPAWTITKNFVYDPVNNNTEFFASNSNFGSNGGPNLNFRLYGAATPEPGALALFASLGLTGAAFLRRRQRSRKAL